MIRFLVPILCLGLAFIAQPASSQSRPPVDAFFNYSKLSDFSLSPNGNHLVVTDMHERKNRLLLIDLENELDKKYLDVSGLEINWAKWATEDRLLVSVIDKVEMKLPTGIYAVYDGKREKRLRDVPVARLVAINIDGSDQMPLFKDISDRLEWNFDLSNIVSTLPNDKDHVLISAHDRKLVLFKVNIHSGEIERVEKGKVNTYGWGINWDGVPVVRYDSPPGGRYAKIFTREPGSKKWEKLAKVRREDLKQFSPVAASDDPGVYYVSARTEEYDRASVFKYDLQSKQFLSPVSTHDRVDLYSALVDSSGKYIGSAYFEDRIEYDFLDDQQDEYMAKVSAHFSNQQNVIISDASANGLKWLLYVHGPQNPGSHHVFNTGTGRIQLITSAAARLKPHVLGKTEKVSYSAGDGMELLGYITRPANPTSSPSPLIVMPHGGPEARDYVGFDPMVQFLTTRGYQVFQPNFRGSSGFGKKFAEAGYGEWGGLMQDDITDGVQYMIKSARADAQNICIAGSSYGGYAALMGAIKTPDLFKCAISINGVTDLEGMVDHVEALYGKNSDTHKYEKRTIGDPKTEEEKLIDNSPVHQVSKIKIPVLIIHGESDNVVPRIHGYSMARKLRASGTEVEYLSLPNVDHQLQGTLSGNHLTHRGEVENYYYGFENTLLKMQEFLFEHLPSAHPP